MKALSFFATVIFLKLSYQETAIMRTAFLMLAIVTLSCCKKKVDDHSAGRGSLINKWELRESYGGWGGHSTHAPGNGYIIEFKGDNSYVTYRKDTVFFTGTYKLKATLEKYRFKIVFHRFGYDDEKDVILKDDTLKILPACCDIPGANYVKIN